MSNDRFNEYVSIDKFLGMNADYENADEILEILNKPLDVEALNQPDFSDFLNLPVNPEYAKIKDDNEAFLKERMEYVESEEYKTKLYEDNVKFYEELLAEAERELSADNVVVNDITDT